MNPVYKSNDGAEWPTEEQAEKRDQLMNAEKQLCEATREVMRCLGETALTADGKQFNMRECNDYWRVAENWFSFPEVEKFWFYPHNVYVDYCDKQVDLTVRWYDNERREYQNYKIKELYTTEKAAKQACKKLGEERIQEMQERIAKM